MRAICLVIVAISLVFTGCSTRPVMVSDVRHAPLTSADQVRVTIAPDQPAPVESKRFAFTIRQIGVGSQRDLNSAIDEGVRNARSLGANLIHVTISEPDARRQKVEVSFYREPPAQASSTSAPTTR